MKISEITAMPANVAGYLDWFSGMLFINEPFATWEEYLHHDKDSVPERRMRNLVQTITHETYHFLQIATTGYLYVFASRVFSEIATLIGPIEQNTIDEIVSHPPQPSDTLNALFATFNDMSSGVSTRALVETAAYVYEQRTHHRDLTDEEFREILAQERPPAEYRVAYEVLHQACGDCALANLLPLTFMALCFSRPSEVYPLVVAAAARQQLRYKTAADLQNFFDLIPELPTSIPLLGTSAEVAARWSREGREQHPIYYPAIEALNDMADRVSPIRLMVEPDAMSLQDAAEITRPTRLNDGHVFIPAALEKRMGEEGARDLVFGLSIMAALSHKIFNNREERVRVVV